MEGSPGIDESPLELVVRGKDLRFQAEMAGQVHGPDLFRQETVGPSFDEVVAELLGQDLPADAAVFFEQQDVDRFAVGLCPGLEMHGRGQPGNTAAYDDYFHLNPL